jgi:5-formyltetrahydrofolate cyclo-ligase
MPKAPIRSDMLARRRQLPDATRLFWSRCIQAEFLRLPEFGAAQRIALYSPVYNEVATSEVFAESIATGRLVYFPRVREESLEFVLVSDERELQPGAFGIPEPMGKAVVPIEALDLLVVPGIAFDLVGHRLGYGKGFYDRMLHGQNGHGTLVGLCYEMQITESLPVGCHDVRMDLLVTENRVLRFSKQQSSDTPLEEDLP